jgi:MYXO-CTERM domain-containing protein
MKMKAIVGAAIGLSFCVNPLASQAIQLDTAYVEASYSLDFGRVGGEGASSDGNTLWILDNGNMLHSYDISGGGFSEISSIDVQAGGDGLAWDGTGLWVSNVLDYYKLDPLTGNIVDSFVAASSTNSFGGLTYDGQYLWKASRPEFNQLDPATGNIINTIGGFDLPGIEEGLAYDGTYLYSLTHDFGNNPTIWKIDPVSGLVQSDSFALPTGSYNGLAYDGQSLWAVGASEQRVYKISAQAQPTPVTIDIKPGSDPNSFNPRSQGVIPVAVLGTIDFDATQIDFTTVIFGPYEATPAHDGHVEDVNNDGFMDAVFHFRTQETGIVCGDIEATLNGELFDETRISGTDTVNTVGCSSARSASTSSAASVSWMLLAGLGVFGFWRQNRRQ